ncbi:MAG: tetratricopeptide repeat protein [Bacteroidetes bacterium]|nr:tetratricopeptide repeat protein [Bacteroidota bacterium]
MEQFSISTFRIAMCYLLFAFSFPWGRSGWATAQSLQDAIKFTESEQFEKASDAYVSLIQREPTSGDNYFFFGENYFKQEIIDSSFKAIELDSAKILYQKGLSKNPGNPINYVGLGKVLWYEGKPNDAKKQFYDAVQIISPANKTASFTPHQKALVYMKIAECYIKAKNKDLPEAINLLNKALKEEPNNPEIYILMGDAMLEQNPGDASQAIGQYKKASELDKKSCKALLRIGQLYNRARNLPEAVRNYDAAIAVDPNFAPAFREKAEVYYRGKQYEAAITNYQKYLEINSGSVSSRVRYASFLFLSKKYNEAITSIQEIQKQNPSIIFLYRLLAYSYSETGNCTDGLKAIDEFFLKADPKKNLASDYEYNGKLLSKCGKDSLAVEKLKLAIQQDTSKTELNGDLGKALVKTKKYHEAIEAFSKKIRGGKSVDANDYYSLGLAYYYSKQCGKADTAFMQIVILRPDILLGYLYRAKANTCLDPDSKKGLAKPFYEDFLSKIKPEELDKNKNGAIEAYDYLGYYFMLQKDYAKAKCMYLKLKELDPNNAKAKKALAEPNVVKANCSQ